MYTMPSRSYHDALPLYPSPTRRSSDLHRQAQGHVGEAEDAVRAQLHQLAERVLRLPRVARLAAVRDADLAESDPREEAADVAVVLAHVPELVERTPVDEAEVAGVGRDVDVAEPAQDAVEEADRGAAEEGLDAPVLANGVDDLVALAPACDQVGRELGRVLEV